LELCAVVRGEVDRVLVRDVHAGDRYGAVVVHLLDQLARELDRLHVRPEGASEYALDERFDLLLDPAENAQITGPSAASSLAAARGGTGLWRRGYDCRGGLLHRPLRVPTRSRDVRLECQPEPCGRGQR